MRAVARSAGSLTVLGVLAGCVTAGDRSETFALSDSAGVRLAVNQLSPDQVPTWRLVEPPAFAVGVLDGELPYQFSFPLAGALLTDGTIAVLDGGTQQVRYFTADGRHLRTSGREGSGPGEFRQADRFLRLPADSLLVWDEGQRRVTILGPEGAVARTTVVPGGLNPSLVAVATDGGYLMADELFDVPDQGFQDMEVTVSRTSLDGTEPTLLGTYLSMPVGHLGGLGMVGGPLFAPRTSLAAARDGYYVGTARAYEVTRYDSQGAPRQVIRWTGPDRRIADNEVQRYKTDQLAKSSESGRARLEARLAAQPVGDQFPTYVYIMGDRVQGLRVMEFRKPSDPGPSRWLTFDADGRLAGRLELPDGLRVLEWGADYLVGVKSDDEGVEQVVLYRIDQEESRGVASRP